MRSLNFHHLRYFWAVARTESVTLAGVELEVTPQTVSTQIRDLETELGEELFDRTGRQLILTDAGQLVYRHAREIFSVGQELIDSLRMHSSVRPLRVLVGVANVLPKLVAHRLIEPALRIPEPVQVVCHESRAEELLARLALRELDIVLTDAPIPPRAKIRGFNHLLGKCGVTFMASSRLARAHSKEFPRSLEGAPFLLPTEDTVLRRALAQWFRAKGIRPRVVGEFEDSALLKVFGQAGEGVFAVPSIVTEEVCHQYNVRPIGEAAGIVEQFFAISLERQIQHPAVAAICAAARNEIFAH